MRGGGGGGGQPHIGVSPSFLGMDARMTSKQDIALIRKVATWVIDVLDLLTCHLWVFVQPDTGRRPFDWCRNQLTVPYGYMDSLVSELSPKGQGYSTDI